VRRALIVLALAALTAAAPARLTEAQVRTFAARQSALWNAQDMAGYFATFTPGARFTDQALANSNTIVPYGSSSVTQARALAAKSRARGRLSEAISVQSIVLAPDGRGARLSAHVVSQAAGQQFCAQRVETLVMTPSGLRASAQTDTIVRCRSGPLR
jgi:hypothetical protein